MVFDKEWFHDNQKWLLWLLNNRIIGRLARRILWIWEDRKLHELGPSWYVVESGNPGEFVADFRCRDKYARRLYHIAYPIWWLCHLWDSLTKLIPALNLGFDSLTVYPDAHTETTTVDGATSRDVSSESLSTIRSGNGSYAYSNSTWSNICSISASTTTNGYRRMIRGIYLFDTSALTAAVTISAAVMSIYGYDVTEDLGTAYVDVVASSPASNTNLAASDFNIAGWGTTSFGNIGTNVWNVAGYNDITLNAAGRSAVSKTGVTKLGCRTRFDLDNSAPTWSSWGTSSVEGYFADDTSGTKDPKLVVTYTVPVTFVTRITVI